MIDNQVAKLMQEIDAKIQAINEHIAQLTKGKQRLKTLKRDLIKLLPKTE